MNATWGSVCSSIATYCKVRLPFTASAGNITGVCTLLPQASSTYGSLVQVPTNSGSDYYDDADFADDDAYYYTRLEESSRSLVYGGSLYDAAWAG